MGSKYSCLGGKLSEATTLSTSSTKSHLTSGLSSTHAVREQPPPLPLLDLPLDLLHCVFDHLDPASSITFALSCKALYGCYFASALARMRDPSTTRLQVQAVHLALEKDCGDRFFYCHGCDTFHPFSPRWKATQELPYPHASGCSSSSRFRIFRPNVKAPWGCREREGGTSQPTFDQYYAVDYPLARLVMNRHLLGPPRGLPLSCLEAEHVRMLPDSSHLHTWTQTWRARIIHDELFLSAVHTFAQTSAGEGPARAFREQFRGGRPSGRGGRSSGRRAYYAGLCQHVGVCSSMRLPCVAETGPSTAARDLFVPCRDVEGSCTRCLTDTSTTITWHDDGAGAGAGAGEEERRGVLGGSGRWSIVFTTYHRLGHCRSPTDWKFAVAAGNWIRGHWRPDGEEYCAGSVRRQWEESDP